MFSNNPNIYNCLYVKYRKIDSVVVKVVRNLKMGDNMFNIHINDERINDLFYRENDEYFHLINEIPLKEFMEKRGISDYVLKPELWFFRHLLPDVYDKHDVFVHYGYYFVNLKFFDV